MFFSVIIPLYNKERHIKKTIESVLHQTVQTFEIIVVDDGSTDAGADVVKSLTDHRIRLIRQKNAGVSAARNTGIMEASYEILAFLDADDLWKAEYLETIIELYCLFPQCGIYSTGYEYDFGSHSKVPKFKSIPPEPWKGIIPDYFKSMLSFPVWTSAVSIPKYVIENVGGFMVGESHGEDLDLWFRIALKYPIAFNPKPCVRYNQCADSRTIIRNREIKWHGFITTVENALREGSIDKNSIRHVEKFLETLRLRQLSSIILCGDSRRCRELLRKAKFKHYIFKKSLISLFSFLPNGIVKGFFVIKDFISRAMNLSKIR